MKKVREDQIITELGKDVYIVDNFFTDDIIDAVEKYVTELKYSISAHAGISLLDHPEMPVKNWHPVLRHEMYYKGHLVDKAAVDIQKAIKENISCDLYLTRMRVNVEFPLNRKPSKYDWHVDNGMYKDSNLHNISKAMVIYINTTNGYTEFKNKKLGKVYSVRNRALIFPGSKT